MPLGIQRRLAGRVASSIKPPANTAALHRAMAWTVPMMLGTITLLELATGILAAAGFVKCLLTGITIYIFYAGVLAALSLTSLFFGQRLAKDYAGAAVLVPYFLLALATMYLTKG